jgi:hypothetical protein
MAIDFEATKENMKLINKRAFMREMARLHPDHAAVTPEVLFMLLGGYYSGLGSPKAAQVIGYLRETGYLVEIPDIDRRDPSRRGGNGDKLAA